MSEDMFKAPEAELVDPKPSTSSYGSIDKAIAGDYEFTIGGVIKEGWEKTKGAKWAIHVALFWYFLVLVALVVLSQLAMVALVDPVGNPSTIALFSLLQQIVLNLVLMPIVVGIFILGIKRSVDAPMESTSVFDYFNKAASLFLTMFLVYLMVFIGLLLLVLPGIYLAIAYFYSMPLVVEKDLRPWQAMEVSRKAIGKRWFSFFLLSIVISLIVFISAIPLGIGMIWTIPMSFVCYGLLYRNMFGVEGKTLT